MPHRQAHGGVHAPQAARPLHPGAAGSRLRGISVGCRVLPSQHIDCRDVGQDVQDADNAHEGLHVEGTSTHAVGVWDGHGAKGAHELQPVQQPNTLPTRSHPAGALAQLLSGVEGVGGGHTIHQAGDCNAHDRAKYDDLGRGQARGTGHGHGAWARGMGRHGSRDAPSGAEAERPHAARLAQQTTRSWQADREAGQLAGTLARPLAQALPLTGAMSRRTPTLHRGKARGGFISLRAFLK